MNPSTAKYNGLRDRGLSTQEHDDLQLWLHNVENQKKIALQFKPFEVAKIAKTEPDTICEFGWANCINLNYSTKGKRIFSQYSGSEFRNSPDDSLNILEKKTEFTIYGYNKFILGVVDCQLEAGFDCIFEYTKHEIDIDLSQHVSVRVMYPRYSDYNTHDYHEYAKNESNEQNMIDLIRHKQIEANYITGGGYDHSGKYSDIDYEISCKPEEKELRTYKHHFDILCEIKPKLNSISSLLSQINHYKDSIRPLNGNRNFYENIRDYYGQTHKETNPNEKLYTVVITTDANTKYDEFLLNEGIHIYRVPQHEL